jgi:hypothetical protein
VKRIIVEQKANDESRNRTVIGKLLIDHWSKMALAAPLSNFRHIQMVVKMMVLSPFGTLAREMEHEDDKDTTFD